VNSSVRTRNNAQNMYRLPDNHILSDISSKTAACVRNSKLIAVDLVWLEQTTGEPIKKLIQAENTAPLFVVARLNGHSMIFKVIQGHG